MGGVVVPGGVRGVGCKEVRGRDKKDGAAAGGYALTRPPNEEKEEEEKGEAIRFFSSLVMAVVSCGRLARSSCEALVHAVFSISCIDDEVG